MGKGRKAPPLEAPDVPARVEAPPFTTTDYAVVKRLYAAGILAHRNYGSPMTFEYALEDRGRIDAVLGG